MTNRARLGASARGTARIPPTVGGAQGTQGAPGAQGGPGAQGSQGFQGLTGAQGAQGATGSQGGQGFQGNTGQQGAQGFQGATGTTGAQGGQGFQGATGNTGAQGNQGATGSQGAQGFQGATGSQGGQGFQGNTGQQGAQGFQGAVGSQGFQGATGAQGSQGAQGNGSGPFRATYYVDPAFGGVSTGSSSNPYTTIAAAFAAAAALSQTAGIIYIPPNATVTENVTFPTTGDWEIASQITFGQFSAIISGTIDLSTSAAAQRALTNLDVTGAVSGAATGSPASRLYLRNVQLGSTLTLTGVSAAVWRVWCDGGASPNLVGQGGNISGAVAITGVMAGAWAYLFLSSITTSVTGNVYINCQFSSTSLNTNGAGAVSVTYYDCIFSANTVLTASSGSMTVSADGPSAANLQSVITTTSGTVTIRSLNSNGSPQRQTLAANSGTITLANRYPTSLCVVEFTLTILVAGTAGALQFNLTYTDITGTAQSKTLLGTPLSVTSAAGTEVSGSLIFSQNGATAIQCTVSGVVTAGSLSYSLGAAVRSAS